MRNGIVTTCTALLCSALSTAVAAAEPAGPDPGATKGADAGAATPGEATARPTEAPEGGTTGPAASSSEAPPSAPPRKEPGAAATGSVTTTAGVGTQAGASEPAGVGAQAGASDEPAADEAKPRRRPRDRADVPWIKRWAPEPHMGELGVYTGLFFPSRRLELFEVDDALPEQGFKEFRRTNAALGLRVGYAPIRFFGVEGETGLVPTRTADDQAATLWNVRLSAVGQLGLWSVTPFVTLGGGMLNVSSFRAAVGSDVDASVHFGGGVKVYLSRYAMVRLDVRDHVTAGQGVRDRVGHSAEVLLGFSVTLGRKKTTPPEDSDRDGLVDPSDACPQQPGVAEYRGCPVPDTDGDGTLDPDDQCKDEVGPTHWHGCPVPDTDGDGVLDDVDACKDVVGVVEYEGLAVAKLGCPVPDTDADGIVDPDDLCITEPENPNQYKDRDGCPDEVPKAVSDKFSGPIQGIHFETGKAEIKAKKSKKALLAALKVMQDYPDVKVEISGHTDDVGGRDQNLDLSLRRAIAVKDWLVAGGVLEARINVRGAGPDEPIASNQTKKGRAKNRRIEFKRVE